eukprot:Hpha_TRINITY_DN24954_c0_g1::TRINITY_DN24954_c0_g1_i1::g.111166::m.111166
MESSMLSASCVSMPDQAALRQPLPGAGTDAQGAIAPQLSDPDLGDRLESSLLGASCVSLPLDMAALHRPLPSAVAPQEAAHCIAPPEGEPTPARAVGSGKRRQSGSSKSSKGSMRRHADPAPSAGDSLGSGLSIPEGSGRKEASHWTSSHGDGEAGGEVLR